MQKYVLPQHVVPEIFAVKGCLKTKPCCRCWEGTVIDGWVGCVGVTFCSGGGVNSCGGGGNYCLAAWTPAAAGTLAAAAGTPAVAALFFLPPPFHFFPLFRVHCVDAALRHLFAKTILGNRYNELYTCWLFLVLSTSDQLFVNWAFYTLWRTVRKVITFLQTLDITHVCV